MKNILVISLILLSLVGCGDDKQTKINSFEKAKKVLGKQNVVLEIGSSSCKSCIDMKKMINTLKTKDPEIPIMIVDVYDDMKSFSFFKIQLIPTQIVFNKKGEEIYRHVGGVSKDEMLKLVELSKR